MKRLLTILLLAAGIFQATLVKAQKVDTVNTSKWFKHDIAGAALIQVTYRKTNLNQLNTILNRNGIPALGNNNIWINASMTHVIKKVVLEDGIGFTPITSSEVNGIKARYNQYQAFFRAGYNVSNNPDFRLFPFAGINFNAAVLNIRDDRRTQSTSDFSNELLNSTSSKTFYQPNFGIDLGAGFDYLIKLKSKQINDVEIQRNIPIGVRLGYYINASQGDWKVDDHSLQNGPNNKNSAFFVSVNIGLGYKIRKR
jgi:hypothetical protein